MKKLRLALLAGAWLAAGSALAQSLPDFAERLEAAAKARPEDPFSREGAPAEFLDFLNSRCAGAALNRPAYECWLGFLKQSPDNPSDKRLAVDLETAQAAVERLDHEPSFDGSRRGPTVRLKIGLGHAGAALGLPRGGRLRYTQLVDVPRMVGLGPARDAVYETAGKERVKRHGFDAVASLPVGSFEMEASYARHQELDEEVSRENARATLKAGYSPGKEAGARARTTIWAAGFHRSYEAPEVSRQGFGASAGAAWRLALGSLPVPWPVEKARPRLEELELTGWGDASPDFSERLGAGVDVTASIARRLSVTTSLRTRWVLSPDEADKSKPLKLRVKAAVGL